MKKIFLLQIILCTSLTIAFSQPCTSTEQLRELPTKYKKDYNHIDLPDKEQLKYLDLIFTNVTEPALKKTKGLDVKWAPRTYANSPNDLSVYGSYLYMNGMRCDSKKQVSSKGISNFILTFSLNSLSMISENMRLKQSVDNGSDTYTPIKINNSQVYILDERTLSDNKRYSSLNFYRYIPLPRAGDLATRNNEDEYFLITKKGIPFFIPVTIKQALEISIANNNKQISNFKKGNKQNSSVISKEAWIKKDGVEPVEGAISVQQAKEINDAGYQGYLEGTKAANEQSSFFTDNYEKSNAIMTEFLKEAPAKLLSQPAYANSGFGVEDGAYFSDIKELYDAANAKELFDQNLLKPLVIINPAYIKSGISKNTPQFICINANKQIFDDYTKKVYRDFLDALDFDKLEQILQK